MAMQISMDGNEFKRNKIERDTVGGNKVGGNKVGGNKSGAKNGMGFAKGRDDELSGREVTRGAAAVWLFTKIASVLGVAVDACGHLASLTMERITGGNRRVGRQRQMKLVESLALGNRRQLLLIACGNQRYLVGAGADNVGSILAMEPELGSRDVLHDRRAKRPERVGPELVDAGVRLRSRETEPHGVSESGRDLWH